MKRLALFVSISVLFFAFTPSSATAEWKDIGRFLKSQLPTVTLPGKVGIGGNGFQFEKYNVVIRNGVRMRAKAMIFAYGKKLATLGSGGEAVDDRKTQLHNERIPIMAFFYEDAGDGKLGKFIGIATKQAYFYPGYPQSQPSTFQIGDILRPDGQQFYGYGQDPIHAIPDADMSEQVVHLPRKWYEGTTGLQVGNVSSFTVRLRVNGRTLDDYLPPEGGMAYFEWQTIPGFSYGATRSIQLDYLQENGKGADGKPRYLMIKADYDIPLSLNSYGIEGRQLVIGPPPYGARLY